MAAALRFSKKVAFRYLWSKRSEAFITIITVISLIGVALSVAVLNIAMAIMSGFQYELRNKIIGADSHIIVRNIAGQISGWRKMEGEMAAVPGIHSVSPFTLSQVLLRAGNSSSGVLIRGIAEGSASAQQLQNYLERPQKVADLFNPPALAEGEGDARLPGMVIGMELARNLSLHVGDALTVISPELTSSPFGLVPRFRRFVVAGIYSSGLVEYEGGLAYISLPEAQKFFHFADAISGFEVRVDDVDRSPEIAKSVSERLSQSNSGIYAQDWTERNRPLWEAIQFEKKVYFVVLLLLVVLASFSIITTLVMIVIEKRRDIGVLLTLGADAKGIANIFRIQGAVVGAIGTVSGVALGYVGCVVLSYWWKIPLDAKVFQMTSVPVRIELSNFLSVAVAAFLICLMATVYPAYRASRADPAESLRFE